MLALYIYLDQSVVDLPPCRVLTPRAHGPGPVSAGPVPMKCAATSS